VVTNRRSRGDQPLSLRVVVVAGSHTRVRQLERRLAGPGLEIVGVALDATSAEELVASTLPSAVLVDLDLFMGGLEAVERIMAGRPTPIVVYGAAAGHPETALSAGALSVVNEVSTGDDPDDNLRARLRAVSTVPVITHPRARLRSRLDGVGRPPPAAAPRVVAIGASTGGPPALATVLGGLPSGFEAAVIVVQHMAEGFVEGLARWLDSECPLPVSVAANGDVLRAGRVFVAPAGRNTTLGPDGRLSVTLPPPRQYHVPGVDVAFTSVAERAGARSVGVLLTGMGRDGAAGLLAIRAAGGMTFGQDEASSVVWGMPGVARDLGAVTCELPLGQVAAAVVDAVRRPVVGRGSGAAPGGAA